LIPDFMDIMYCGSMRVSEEGCGRCSANFLWLKMAVFRVVAPLARHNIALMMETASISETSVKVYLPDYTAQQPRRQPSLCSQP
jgi:hypothetical protein